MKVVNKMNKQHTLSTTRIVILVFSAFLLVSNAFGLPATALVVTTSTSSRQAVTFSDPVGNPTGQTLMTGLPANANPEAIMFFGNDAALVVDGGLSQVFVIQPSTGTLLSTIVLPFGCSGVGASRRLRGHCLGNKTVCDPGTVQLEFNSYDNDVVRHSACLGSCRRNGQQRPFVRKDDCWNLCAGLALHR